MVVGLFIDSQGAIVTDGNFEAIRGNQSIYFSTELHPGFYIISIRLGQKELTKKFIVQ